MYLSVVFCHFDSFFAFDALEIDGIRSHRDSFEKEQANLGVFKSRTRYMVQHKLCLLSNQSLWSH